MIFASHFKGDVISVYVGQHLISSAKENN